MEELQFEMQLVEQGFQKSMQVMRFEQGEEIERHCTYAVAQVIVLVLQTPGKVKVGLGLVVSGGEQMQVAPCEYFSDWSRFVSFFNSWDYNGALTLR